MIIKDRFFDIFASLRHAPSGTELRRAAIELCWAVPLMVLVAHLGGLVRLQEPPETITMIRLAATLLVAPALGEELLFRGLMIPRERPSPKWLALSVLLFVLWHPLQALTFGPPWAAAFLDPWFLAVVAILGTALGRIYAATRSLWPCIGVHWLVILCWKVGLGGPF